MFATVATVTTAQSDAPNKIIEIFAPRTLATDNPIPANAISIVYVEITDVTLAPKWEVMFPKIVAAINSTMNFGMVRRSTFQIDSPLLSFRWRLS